MSRKVFSYAHLINMNSANRIEARKLFPGLVGSTFFMTQCCFPFQIALEKIFGVDSVDRNINT